MHEEKEIEAEHRSSSEKPNNHSECLADAGKTLEIKPGDEVTINGHKIVYDKDKGYVTIVKSEESVPKDLEEAADEYLQKVKAWFLRTLEHPTAKDAFKAGAEWDREQMMKEAVEADVNIYRDLVAGKSWAEFVVEMPTNNLGDKVRVIIVKEN